MRVERAEIDRLRALARVGELIERAEAAARAGHAGCLTLMRFSSGWKVMLGTPCLDGSPWDGADADGPLDVANAFDYGADRVASGAVSAGRMEVSRLRRFGTISEALEALTAPKSWVYFIEAVGLARIKIGVSDDPEKRLKQLATGCPTQLRIMKTIPGDAEVERQLHERFSHLRFEREWFHATTELLDYIEAAQ